MLVTANQVPKGASDASGEASMEVNEQVEDEPVTPINGRLWMMSILEEKNLQQRVYMRRLPPNDPEAKFQD
jgi:hypothetical protein